MKEYHKIQSIFKRDPETKFRTFLHGEWTLPEFGYLAGNAWTLQEKIDGMNMRLIWDQTGATFGMQKPFTVFGRSDRAQIPGDLMDRILRDYQPRIAEYFGETPVTLYGEGYGAGIQKGGYYRPDKDFILFDVRIGHMWLQQSDVFEIGASLGMDVAPIVTTDNLFTAIELVRRGFKSLVAQEEADAEGVIARPLTELLTRRGERVITKIKTIDFPNG